MTQPLAKAKEGAEYDSLKDTLSSLPKEVVDEIALASPADGYVLPLVSGEVHLERHRSASTRRLRDVIHYFLEAWNPDFVSFCVLWDAAPLPMPLLQAASNAMTQDCGELLTGDCHSSQKGGGSRSAGRQEVWRL